MSIQLHQSVHEIGERAATPRPTDLQQGTERLFVGSNHHGLFSDRYIQPKVRCGRVSDYALLWGCDSPATADDKEG